MTGIRDGVDGARASQEFAEDLKRRMLLTFDGEPQDIILEAGESHRCTSSAKLAIHALAPAALRVI